jgi:hypothetical protein
MPRRAAASASAAAWFPDDAAATPRRASSSVSERTAFAAPRALKAPTFCRCSHLRNALAPSQPSSSRDVITGVRWTNGSIRTAAARMSSRVGATAGSYGYAAARARPTSSGAAVKIAVSPEAADLIETAAAISTSGPAVSPGSCPAGRRPAGEGAAHSRPVELFAETGLKVPGAGSRSPQPVPDETALAARQ